ncbi:MAG: hypothetical protein EP336_09585 [Rhodobacteraceae bacterium]|nr:MAG: hypothetical protein EP336_09585 [Paracoccaceae bacterium]
MNRILVSALTAVVIFLAGYWQGGRAADNRHAAIELKAQQAQVAAARQIADKEAQRLAAEIERDALAQQLEDQAYADPVDDACGISIDRVRRLNLR